MADALGRTHAWVGLNQHRVVVSFHVGSDDEAERYVTRPGVMTVLLPIDVAREYVLNLRALPNGYLQQAETLMRTLADREAPPSGRQAES